MNIIPLWGISPVGIFPSLGDFDDQNSPTVGISMTIIHLWGISPMGIFPPLGDFDDQNSPTVEDFANT